VLGFVRGANVLGADGTAEDIWAVRRISYPACNSQVEDGITASIDMDVEATDIDIRYLGHYTTISALLHIELLQEDNHLRRVDEGAAKVDAA